MTRVAVVQAIQDVVGALAGIREAPDYPPEQINAPLQAVCYAANGTFREASLAAPGCYEVKPQTYVLLLYLPLKDLPRDMERLLPYVDSIPVALLATKTLSGAVTAINDIRYTFVSGEWGGILMRGYRFEIDVATNAQTYPTS